MKGKTRKAFAVGLALGLVFVAGTAYAAGRKITSAEYNNVKVVANGQAITLPQPLISVVDDATPANSFSNYMPVRTVLESLGYTVTYDGTTETVNIVKPVSTPVPAAPVPAAPAPAAETAPTVEIITADLLVDGEESEFTSGTVDIILVPETDEDGNETTALYVKGFEILDSISTKENYYTIEYDAAANTANINTKPPLAEGKAMREVLAPVGFTVGGLLGQDDTRMEVSIVNGDVTAVLNMPKGAGLLTGTLEYEGETAEFDFYLDNTGSSYIIEESFLQAMKDVGL